MDIRIFLELKLYDCQETVTIKGLCAELGISIFTARKALSEFVESLRNTESASYPVDLIYYYADISKGRVSLKFRPVTSFVSNHHVVAIAAKFEVYDLVETDVGYLLEGRVPTIFEPPIPDLTETN